MRGQAMDWLELKFPIVRWPRLEPTAVVVAEHAATEAITEEQAATAPNGTVPTDRAVAVAELVLLQPPVVCTVVAVVVDSQQPEDKESSLFRTRTRGSILIFPLSQNILFITLPSCVFYGVGIRIAAQ